MSLRSIAALSPGLHAVSPGLYIAIGKKIEGRPGSRSWIFRYTVAGRKRDYGIGSCRELSRDDAEREIARLRDLRRAGIDPIEQRRAGKKSR